MPVYDYKCKDHGVFYGLQTMADYDKPKPCPQCGVASARIILMPPTLFEMDKNTKTAFETNERAQHEPIHSTQDRRKHDARHNKQCGCKKKDAKLFYTAQGEKFFPSMRPWMISH